MPGLLLKHLPDDIHRLLKRRAASHRRSMGAEALVILEQALDPGAGPPTLEEIDAMRVRGARPLTQDLIDQARDEGRP